MKLERFLLSTLLNPTQRQIIWNSLEEVRTTAKADLELEKMAQIELVMHQTEKILDVTPAPLNDHTIMMRTKIAEALCLKTEASIDEVLENIYKRGVQEGSTKFEQVRKTVETQLQTINN